MKHRATTVAAVIIAAATFLLPVSAQINTDQVLRIGRNALAFEDYVLSIQYFNQVINAKPYLAEPYFYRAVAKISLEDYLGAERDATECIERNPFIVDAYEVRGVSRQNMKDYKGAIEDYEHGLTLKPDDRVFLFNKAMCQGQIKDYGHAQEAFDRLLKFEPKNARAYLGLAQIHFEQADSVKALEFLDKSLSLDKNQFNAHMMKADICMRRDSISQALSALNEAITLEPRHPDLFINRAFLKYKLDDYSGAMADYDYAIELDPDNFEAHYNRAQLNAQVAEFNRAIADFSFLLDKDPTNFMARYNRAIIYMQLGNYKKAIGDYDVILKKYPKYETGFMMRGDAKRKIGDSKGGERDFKQAADIMRKKGVHYSNYDPVHQEIRYENKRLEEKQLKQKEEFERAEEGESPEQIIEKFNGLLTLATDNEFKPEYANRSRGHIQNRNIAIEPIEMFTLSFYNRDNKLNGNTYYITEVAQINAMQVLNQPLCVVPGFPVISEEAIRHHFAGVEYYNGLLSNGQPRAIDYFARGMDFFLLKNPTAAISDADRAIAINPDFVIAYFFRAGAKFLQYKMANAASPDASPDATVDAMLKQQTAEHHLREVLADLDTCAKLMPLNVYAHFNRGVVLALQRNLTEALAAYNQAIALKPDLGEAYYNRGIIYLQLGNKERGTADLSRAGELGILPSYNILKRMN